MSNEMPEWFYAMTTHCRDVVWVKHKQKPMKDFDLGSELSKMIWDEISKPQNAAKIPQVKALVEAAKGHLDSYPSNLWKHSKQYKDLNEALKPFEQKDANE